jgi:hypothetical protein
MAEQIPPPSKKEGKGKKDIAQMSLGEKRF